jgi:hypothetical protein
MGSDIWENSLIISTPCSAQTAMANAVAGDIVYFRGGTYDVGIHPSTYLGALMPSHSGTSGNPITFMNYNDEIVVLNGTYSVGPEFCRVLATGNQDWIVFDGFTIQSDNGDRAGSVIMGGDDYSTNCTIRNCIIDGGDNPKVIDDNVEGIRIEKGTDILIQNCYIYDFDADDSYAGISGIKSYDGTNVTVENCNIENCMSGIYMKVRNEGWTVRYNWVNNCYIGVYATPYSISEVPRNCNNLELYQNVIANSSYINLHIYAEGTGRSNNATIYNNTIFEGAETDNNLEMRQGDNFKVYNNIIVGNNPLIKLGNDDYFISEVDHNLFHSSSFYILTHLYNGSVIYNSLSAWQSSGELDGGGNPGEGSLASDPQFVTTSGNLDEIADFALASGSPCIGTGRSGADIGADVSLVGVGAGDETAPSYPTGLSVE